MNKIAEQIMLGSMCGDGTIRHRYKYPVYREAHSIKQEDYLRWKSKLIKELNPKLFYTEENNKERNKIYKKIELYTPMNKNLLRFHKLFYKGRTGNKHISYKVLKMLKPLGLAVWYMDDGSYFYRGSVVELASCMNDFKVQRDIKRYFKNILGLTCSINKAAGGLHIIKLSVESSDRFLKMIQKYIPDCMKYKLGHLCADNFVKLKEAKHKVSECSKLWNKINAEHVSKRQKLYYLKNKDYIRERYNNYYLMNRDKVLSRGKVYREKNKDKISAHQKVYRMKNIDRVHEHSHDYYMKNADSIAAKGKIYRAKNLDRLHARSHDYYMENRKSILIRQKAYNKEKARIRMS